MKVLMINGSRREHGCTYTAMTEMAAVFKEEGIDSEIVVFRDKEIRNLQIAQSVLYIHDKITKAASVPV